MKQNIYKNLYNEEKNSGNLERNPRIKIMLSILNRLNFEEKNILDIGCHDGTFLSLVKNKNNNFYGLEASDWGIEKLREKNIKFQQYFFDDKNKLPYADNFFDIVVAGEIIEHIYDTDFFLEEISRVLKPEGKLLISTPNVASFGRRLLLFCGINPVMELSPNEPDSVGHIRYFTFKTLRKLLKKNKFRVIVSKSDVVNFSKNGKARSVFLAEIFPKLGASIIFISKKQG
jgi:2-polyprenyl-3-methyl-5-hydroxy-6-metoxy-1,4-benzoquinol methylase